MHVQEAIHSRRTAHSWQDTPVPEEVILKGLEAAQMAPCHRLTWPWRFTLPGPVTRKALFEIGIDLKAAKIGGEVTEEFRQLMVAKMGNPALVVVSQMVSEDAMQSQEDYAACASAIQNLSLSLFADGFHSKWSTGGITRDPRTYDLLNILPSEENIIGFIWAGVPIRVGAAPQRPDLTEQLRRVP